LTKFFAVGKNSPIFFGELRIKDIYIYIYIYPTPYPLVLDSKQREHDQFLNLTRKCLSSCAYIN
jgi:hypothetical protein